MAAPAALDARSPVWPTRFRPTRGVVYVATGARYLAEARAAAVQLRRTNPALPICLITDAPDAGPVFWDDLILVTHAAHGFRDKILMALCPYERMLFLDGDTFVGENLDEVFQLLDRFDFAGHQLFEGHDSPIPGVPDAFPEFQGGVLAFRRNAATNGFFTRWLELYDAFRAPDRPDRDAYVNVTDQKSLRLALYESSLRLAVLAPEYNFVAQKINLACAPVRILHGRGAAFGPFAQRLNSEFGNRVYHPTLDVVLHAQIQPRELRRLWWRTTLQLLRRAGVAVTPLALRNWLRRNRSVRRAFLGNPFGSDQ